jgi:quercetin dioxygenase-like cupin family protein
MTVKKMMDVALALISSSPVACTLPAAHATEPAHMEVTHTETRTAAELFPADFSGVVTVTQIVAATPHLSASAAEVAFEPGARTAWHSHPGGQTLFVTGHGWVQERGGRKIDVKAGDVIWTPPGVEHWHGATSTEPMTHVAIQAVVDGKNVDWKDAVPDEQYAAH